MAIRRIDPKAVFRLVSQHDDAILNETDEERDTGQVDKDGKKILRDARWQKYLESLDLEDLVFKPDSKPSYFHVRMLKTSEIAEMNKKHLVMDIVNKTSGIKDRDAMFIDYFNTAVVGLEEDGVVTPITSDEVVYSVALEIGALVSMMTSLGKKLKKV